jgi:hypothetical protein
MITVGVLGVIEVGFGDAQKLGVIEHRMECFCVVPASGIFNRFPYCSGNVQGFNLILARQKYIIMYNDTDAADD